MNNTGVKVSVIMSVYNGADYLVHAIDSILAQTLQDIEFIIVNDGSIDGTQDILENYKEKDNRIILIQNRQNLGLAESLNSGIGLAKGKYIARQDSDDISTPSRLLTQYEYMEAHPEVDVLASNCNYIDTKNRVICKVTHFSSISDQYNHILYTGGILPHGSAFIRKDSIIELNGYNSSYYYSQDAELWLRYLIGDRIIFVLPKILYNFRLTPVSSDKKDRYHPQYHKILIEQYGNNNGRHVDPVITRAKLDQLSADLKTTRFNPVFNALSQYWFALGRYSIKEYRIFRVWSMIIKSFMYRDKFTNHLRKVPWFLIAFLPYSLTVRVRHRFLFLKEAS